MAKMSMLEHLTALKRGGQLKKGASKGKVRSPNQKGVPRYGNHGVRQVALD